MFSASQHTIDQMLASLDLDYGHYTIQSNTQCKPTESSLRQLLNRNYLVSPFLIPRTVFRVMSYNILADCQVKKHNAGNQYADLKYRSILLFKEIEHYNPDILCLQEVDQDNKSFYEQFQNDYHIYYKKRTHDNQEGCMTLIKKSRYKVLETHYLEFFHQERHPVLCRYNVCLITVIQSKKESEANDILIVANTHILFNKGRGDIKAAQAYLSLKACSMLAERYKDRGVHVIFAGDFNSTPQSGIYEFINKGKFDFRNVEQYSLSGQNLGNIRNIDIYNSLEEFLSQNIRRCEYSYFEREQQLDRLKKWLEATKNITLNIKSFGVGLHKIEYLVEQIPFDEDTSEMWMLENDFEMGSAYGDFQEFYSGFLYKEYPEEVKYVGNSSYEPLYTHKTEEALLTVDYIWYATRYKHHRKTLKPVAVFEMPRISCIFKENKIEELPNSVYPSDHISLVVDFEIN